MDADDAVGRALDDAFQGRTVADVGETGPSWNDRNRTVEVRFDGGESAFLKVAVDGDGSRVAREAAVIEYAAAHCDIEVPTVLDSDADGPVPYLATAPIAGRDFHVPWRDWTTEERAAGIRRVGAALAAVHAETFERPGDVVGGDASALALETGSWTDVLAERIAAKREIASSERFDHYFDEVIEAVRANRERLDRAPATLVHGDPAMPNVFLCDDALGFVDWELAHVGDPVWDVHVARSQLLEARDLDAEERFVAALRDGYRDRADSLPDGYDERLPVYEAVDLLLVAGFFEKMVEWQDKPTERYAAWLDAEMRRRLDALR
ncbi:MAG: phosphotransferase family protein [Haloarculaceae archaeon]